MCLLVGLTATVQAAPPTGLSAPRPIVLTGKAGESSLLYLAPGTFTVIILDAPIVRESVQVESRDRFARVDPAEQGITLALTVPLKPTERLALRFTYREGLPRSAVLLLTGKPGQVDTLVSVSRPPQTLEACHGEMASMRERCEAQGQQLEELKAQPPALSPAAVVLAGLVDSEGMTGLNLKDSCVLVSGELHPARCWGFGASTWSVVALEVSNLGAEPWTPSWAEVTPTAGGAPRRARTVLSTQASIPPGGTVSVTVEVLMPRRKKEEWLRALHTLRVCDATGSRCLFLPKVRL